MNPIETLPLDVVHRMAAGEVIDSLAAVVRELVENALDAGASRIAIALWSDRWRVSVTDNGSGISQADLERAAAPHSTSKIRDRADLTAITTLGFRGEALHSLAQLADLTISSGPAASTTGWQVQYDPYGQPFQVEPIALSPGTVVLVDRLFANWTARRQGLPSSAQQLRAIQTTIYHFALCHPAVTWQVHLSDRPWFSLFPGETARTLLPQMIRDLRETDLQELQYPSAPSPASPASLSLLLGLPDRCHRRRPDWIKIGLNGRMIQLPDLEQTILTALRRTLPRDRFPVCFVHLHLPAVEIDWNRHPAKTEVYLHWLEYWQEQVQQAIDQALRLATNSASEPLYSQRVRQLLKTAEASASYAPEAESLPAMISLRAIAQVHQMYILAEHPSGVWLIEQHIAHERVLYEQLCDRWQIVPLDSPLMLNALSPAQVEQLQRIGLEIDPFGEATWMVRTVPAPLAQRSDCPDALVELSLGGDLQTAQVAIACRTALRNGIPLSLSQMQTLLDQWQQCRHPRTCPHGRPICLSLEESSLSRFFRRHWVIGKSHGI